jgi:hypothetical protein
MEVPIPSSPKQKTAIASGDASVAVTGNLHGNVSNSITHIHEAAPVRPDRWLHTLQAPLPDSRFVGRGHEKKQLKQVLSAAKRGKVALTALRGMGGVGKTALAVIVANQLKDQFPDAQLFIPLSGTTIPIPPGQVMANVIRAFDPDIGDLPSDFNDLQAAYRSVLAGKKVLLVLDNARNAEQIRPLLPPEGCGLITTSRDTLTSLASELVLIPIGLLTEEEAAKLLRTLVKERGTIDELKALAKLCGYLPLALNVAGSFMNGHAEWTFAEYIAALERERLKRLKLDGDPTKDVEAVLAVSAAQLVRDDPELAAHWQHLSVFPADFDEMGAAAVLDFGTDGLRAKDVLSKLLSRSLVLFDEQNARHRLHDLIQEVASKTFDCGVAHSFGETTQVRLEKAARRHAEHYEQLLSRVNDGLESADRPTQRASLKLLEPEGANLVATAKWVQKRLAAGAREEDPLLVTLALEFMFLAEGALRHLFITTDLEEKQRQMANSLEMANGFWGMADFQSQFGDPKSAIEFAEKALAGFEAHQDPRVDEVRAAIAKWQSLPPGSDWLDNVASALVKKVLARQTPPSEDT